MKFFRKNRSQSIDALQASWEQSLVSENPPDHSGSVRAGKIKKYLTYATGEIILVVIGILIAIAINNWNEQHKASQQEVILLKQLQLDLNNNLNGVLELNERLEINKVGIDSLLSRIDKKQYHTRVPLFLAAALRKSDFNNASSGYKLMQNGKASLISDDAILKAVLTIYENDFPDIISRQNDMNTSIEFIQRNFVNKLFVKYENKITIKIKHLDVVATDLFIPIDYESITENIELKNTLIQLGKLIDTRLAYRKKTEDHLNATIALLDSKLDLE